MYRVCVCVCGTDLVVCIAAEFRRVARSYVLELASGGMKQKRKDEK